MGKRGRRKSKGGRGDGDWGPKLYVIKADERMKVKQTHPKAADLHHLF